MRRLLAFVISLTAVVIVSFYFRPHTVDQIITPDAQNPSTQGNFLPNMLERFPELIEWKRPEGPAKIALQVGHWKTDQVPEELDRIRNNTGASWNGIAEWEVNYEIAKITQAILEERGIEVDILPATVPPSYWADAFIAIHADGNTDSQKSGFKVASPRRDYSGKSDQLVSYIENEYQAMTFMEIDPNITRNMTGYYAFSWWRNEYAIHPMTAAAILESGFLTSYTDRLTILDNPEAPAEGLANGIIKFLKVEGLI